MNFTMYAFGLHMNTTQVSKAIAIHLCAVVDRRKIIVLKEFV